MPSPLLARFTVAGDGVRIRFRAYEGIRSGHLSRYRRGAQPEEHHFLGAVDRRLYTTVPPPWREDFHGRFEDFDRLSEAPHERLFELAAFTFVAIHAGHGIPRALLTFERVAPGARSLRFGVAFAEVGTLVMRAFADIRTFTATPGPPGRSALHLRGPESEISFDFASVRLAGVHLFRGGSL